MAQLIGLAINNPKEFPKPEDFLRDQSAPRRITTEDELRAFFMARVNQKPDKR